MQLFYGLIILVRQRFDGFVVFDFRLGLGLGPSGLEQSDMGLPFLHLRIDSLRTLFVCPSQQASSSILVDYFKTLPELANLKAKISALNPVHASISIFLCRTRGERMNALFKFYFTDSSLPNTNR